MRSSPLFVHERHQLGDRFEVLGPAGGALDVNEVRQIQDAARAPEQRHLDRVRHQLFARAAAGDFSQQIDPAHGGREREVQTVPDGVGVETEWQTRWRTTKIRIERPESRHQLVILPAERSYTTSRSSVRRADPCAVAAAPPTTMKRTPAS